MIACLKLKSRIVLKASDILTLSVIWMDLYL